MILAQIEQGDIINPQTLPTYLPGPTRFGDIGSIVNLITPLLTLGAALIFLVMLFYGGFTILTAGGDPAKYDTAKKIVTFAVIGLLIVLLAFLAVRVIGTVLNVPTTI